MTYEQEDDFKLLKRRILGIGFVLPEGQVFTFHDLNRRANVQCSKAVQQNVGRWFAYFVKMRQVFHLLLSVKIPMVI